MRCPNRKCRRETPCLLVKVDKGGKVREGCHACLSITRESNVRTGKKIWTGEQVDGEKRNREKIHEFGERLASRAAENRRRNWRPSELERA